MKNIYLIGYMGVGKSAVSVYLSEIMGLEAVETDSLISEKAAMSISEIFERLGEPAFRRMESDMLGSIASHGGYIVSCGGGTPLSMKNLSLMKLSGVIVLLTASPQTVMKRLSGDHTRPLLEGVKSVDRIADMLRDRMPRYRNAADMIVDTDNISPREVAEEISKLFGER